MKLNIDEAIQELRSGNIIAITHQLGVQSQAYFVVSAQKVTVEKLVFLMKNGSGELVISLAADHVSTLSETPIANSLELPHSDRINYTNDVGYSASDNKIKRIAELVQSVEYSACNATQLREIPGIKVVRTKHGGVFTSATVLDAAADLTRIAELGATCVLSAVHSRYLDSKACFLRDAPARTDGVDFIDILNHLRQNVRLITLDSPIHMPTSNGIFSLQLFEESYSGVNHLAMITGEINTSAPVLVRLHSECLTGDIFGSLRCDCGEQLEKALELITVEERGVFLYLRQEGRGIGLANKLRAYKLQEGGMDTVEANEQLGFPPDLRDYKVAAEILSDLGINQVRLMTNNGAKVKGLERYGIEVTDVVPIHIEETKENEFYMSTKRLKMGHRSPFDDVRIKEPVTAKLT